MVHVNEKAAQLTAISVHSRSPSAPTYRATSPPAAISPLSTSSQVLPKAAATNSAAPAAQTPTPTTA